MDVVVSSQLVTKHDIISVYPNPAKNVLFVENTNNTISSYSIYDITGKLVYETNGFNRIISIDISDLKSGQYIISFDSEIGIIKRKFIKK
ncbi:MAG: hypothetical protein C0596_14985 [Marinilabiliales bacterium]|nr:MAG: hypothetical protein C0596_14985 [Marinilabiliales bacterium]